MSPRQDITAEFEEILAGGDPRSLGRVDEVIEHVLAWPEHFPALFDCFFSPDETVRMRAGDAIEKLARTRPDLLTAHRARLLADVPGIEQPSVQWHLAQMLTRIELTPRQRVRAVQILRRNLDTYDDWIVVNLTLEALAHFARSDPVLRRDLIPVLRNHRRSRRKSIARRAARLLAALGEDDR